MNFALIGQLLTTCLTIAWTVSGALVLARKSENREPSPLSLAIYHELRPFFRPLALAGLVFDVAGGALLLGLIYCGICFWIWKLLRDADDDDDRWKRRHRTLTRKVQVVSGQLVIVPAGAR